EQSDVPLPRVDEPLPRQLHRSVVEGDRNLDPELLPGGEDGKVVEAELTAEVRKRMGNGGAVIEPVGAFAYKAEVHARRGEVVPDRDAVQVVRRSVGFNDRARCRVEQGWDRHRVREGDADGGYWRAGRSVVVVVVDS